MMNKIDFAIGLILTKLERNLKDRKKDMFLIQKKIYLMQSFGTDMGFSYIYYVRGPYSPMLTSYLEEKYNLLKIADTLNKSKNYQLSQKTIENIDKINHLIECKPTDSTCKDWLELLSTIVYIFNNEKTWKLQSEDDLKNVLNKQNKSFKDKHIKSAINLIKKYI